MAGWTLGFPFNISSPYLEATPPRELADMYRFWNPIIEPLFERLEPRVIVEIGSDQGLNTRNLVDYARRTGAVVHVIDPLPKYDVDEWLDQYPGHMVFHKATSHDVLGSIHSPDVVLIDGDHNWHTVFNELKILQETGPAEGSYPFVILHDVGWPYGRRDLYYEPDRIPSPHRHRHRQEGMRLGQRDLDPQSGLNAHLFNAEQDGGARNGVLTAVEDFIGETSIDLRFFIVPGINGLGLLYPGGSQDGSKASRFVDDLSSGTALLRLLEIVEESRLESQIESLDQQVEREKFRRELASRVAELTALNKRVDAIAKERDTAIRERDATRTEKKVLSESVRQLRSDERDARREEMAAKSQMSELRLEASSLGRQLKTAQSQTARAQSNYNKLRARRSVRFALRVASVARPVVRLLRESRPSGSLDALPNAAASDDGPLPRKPLDSQAQVKLAKAIVKQRPGSSLSTGPMVSIVVLTRDGSAHMRRLLARLDDTTTYRSFELIVVDNGSTDGTADILAVEQNFPISVIRNDHNTSFSEGNNQGVAAARGELLLFLNNDIEPINPGWLGSLVEAVQLDSVAAAGAVLVYPLRGQVDTDLTVQHAGIRFGWHFGAAHAFNVPASDPLSPSLSGVFDVPAATAAVLMVTADAFNNVGGFDEGYIYGTEDVDLNLKLGRLGKVVVTGQSVLFHHESATQNQVAAAITNMNRRSNRQRFAEHWAPQLTRSLRRDLLTGQGRYSGTSSRTVALTITRDDPSKGYGDYYTAHELGDAFASAGWNVVYLERFEDRWYEADGDIDLLIALLDSYDVSQAPAGAFTIAWIRNWVERWLEKPWFEHFDVAITSSQKGADAIAQGSRFVPRTVPLATNPERFAPGPPVPTFAADYVFTGNNWGHSRGVVRLLDVQGEERFHVYGKGWDSDPRVGRYWRGSLDYELLPEVYRSAKLVLDDTAFHALPEAFMNSRVFDALASGTLVLTNNIEGSQELFDGMLPTYTNREELRSQLDQYLHDDDARARLADQLRGVVLAQHTYVRRQDQILGSALDHLERPQCAIKIAVPDTELMAQWGDTHFGSALAAALASRGMPAKVHILPEWDLPANQEVDVVIHIRGLTSYTPKPAHVNVLWLVSHPDDVTVRECEKYDLVLVASKRHAEWLADQITTPVVFMPQATDHRRFRLVESRNDLATEVLFLGNSRNQQRPAVDWAIQRGLPLTVYGGGWEGRIPSRYVAADLFPNDQLASLYASARVALNDHWADMRQKGFVSNRIFDVLASGGIVVSDQVDGLEDLFGDLVPTYSSPEELEHVVREIMADEHRSQKVRLEGHTLVTKEHTFTRRAEQILDLIRPLLGDRRADLEGNLFDWG